MSQPQQFLHAKDLVGCPQCGGQGFVQTGVLTKTKDPMLIGAPVTFNFTPSGAYCSKCGTIVDFSTVENEQERAFKRANKS
jgi:hypothetical protein